MDDASEGELAWPDDAVEVGCITEAWGIKGWFKVKPFSSDPQALFSSRRWFVKPPEVSGPKAPERLYPRLLTVSGVKEHGDGVVAQARDVDDRATAESLRGARLFVSRQSFPSVGPDEFYWIDLLGLSVINRDGDLLGEVVGLIDTGPHSVLRVLPSGAGDAESERLIPFVAVFIDDVSLEQRRITVDWGLDY